MNKITKIITQKRMLLGFTKKGEGKRSDGLAAHQRPTAHAGELSRVEAARGTLQSLPDRPLNTALKKQLRSFTVSGILFV